MATDEAITAKNEHVLHIPIVLVIGNLWLCVYRAAVHEVPVQLSRRSFHKTASIIALVALAGCSEGWPPENYQTLRHFERHENEFIELADLMRATDYTRVSWDLDRLVGEFAKPQSDPEVIASPEHWISLMRTTDTSMVARSDYGVTLAPGRFWGDGTTISIAKMILDNRDATEHYRVCKPEHESLRCGACVVPLKGAWLILYEWRLLSLDGIAEPDFEAFPGSTQEGDQAWAEYHARVNEQRAAVCRRDLQAMGYNTASFTE